MTVNNDIFIFAETADIAQEFMHRKHLFNARFVRNVDEITHRPHVLVIGDAYRREDYLDMVDRVLDLRGTISLTW